jgi:protein disulfide-isomerase
MNWRRDLASAEREAKIMKRIAMGVIVALALFRAGAEELQWLTDLSKAEEQAKAEKKVIMLDFTGSDWCGWCIKLNREVFSQADFAKYAKDNLVLVEVDFPHAKKQSEELKKANQALQEKYKIDGYPTIIVLDAAGKKIGETGYVEGGPKAFIAELEKLRKNS